MYVLQARRDKITSLFCALFGLDNVKASEEARRVIQAMAKALCSNPVERPPASDLLRILLPAPEPQQTPQVLSLPDMREGLVARDESYAEIKAALLGSSAAGLVGVTSSIKAPVAKVWGMGGVGKTTLARQVSTAQPLSKD